MAGEQTTAVGVTVHTIMDWLHEQIAKRIPITPAVYLDSAQKLVVLLQDIDEDLIRAEMDYRREKSLHMTQGASGIEAETRAKGSARYAEYLQLKALRERVMATVQIAKKRTELQTFDV